MEKLDIYWGAAALLVRVSTISITGSLFYRFISPFLCHKSLHHKAPDDKKPVRLIKLSYIFMMLLLSAIPFEMSGMMAHAVGILFFFGVIYVYDRRNPEQKIFLLFLMYLIDWISYEIASIPREFLFQYVMFSDSVTTLTERVNLGLYVLTESCYVLCRYFAMRLLLVSLTAFIFINMKI